MRRGMVMVALLAFLLTPIPVSAVDAPYPQRDDQQRAWEARREGRVLPFPEIKRRVLPTMPDAQFLGTEFDPDSGIYTFKFLRNGSVIWLRVDGRSGQIIERRGGR